MQTRRTFGKLATAALAHLVSSSSLLAQDTPDSTMSYMDGYHGGIVGHMPPGSWRDILSALEEFPDWKISLDIEPDSWVALRREDPESFARLAALLAKGDRVEMVGGTFAQPYGWAVSGESNIRQLQRGLRIIRKSFPDLPVTTYAVQEPCWASCLPQILRSLGMRQASLKDASTAWGGYTAGFDADVVRWVGPDGTSVAAVPRYAVERLRFVFETESIDATPEFAERCRRAGIRQPAGMCFQDLGWPAKPRVRRAGVTYRTWREYFAAVGPPKAEWHFTPEDILVTLPWGDATLRGVAQQVRSAEDRLVTAEKLASLAAVVRELPFPTEQLDTAWRALLLSQAHDAWITATTRSGRQAWAFTVAKDTLDAETGAEDVIARSMEALALRDAPRATVPLRTQQVLLCNTLGSRQAGLVSISVATDPHTSGLLLRDEQGHAVETQTVVDRSYNTVPVLTALSEQHEIATVDHAAPAGGVNHATLLARVELPALGYRCFTVEPVYDAPPPRSQTGISVQNDGKGNVVIASDLYRMRLDGARGGVVSSLVSLPDGTELLSAKEDRQFGEYRGYFIEEHAWRSSTDQPATLSVKESGPLRVVVQMEGSVGSARTLTTLTVVQGEPRLDYMVELNFAKPTWIGDPVEVPAAERRTQPRRSQNDGHWKLQVHHPFGPGGELHKSAAFDVCKSRNEDTSFQRWDAIKHNIIAQWIDLYQPGTDRGLAVMCDGTTAYNYGPEQPLGLVLAWAWDGGFWWGKHPIEGRHTVRYALLPHRRRWAEAGLWHQYGRFCEPLRAAIASLPETGLVAPFSLVDTGDAGLALSAAEMEDGALLLLRFFNGESAAHQHRIRLGFRPAAVEQIELSGASIRRCAVTHEGKGEASFPLEVPHFGLATVRCTLART